MEVKDTDIITITRHIDAPPQADAMRLDALCVKYGEMISVFLNAFQTRELRQEAFHYRDLRNRLVKGLANPEDFKKTKARLIKAGRTAEARLLTAIYFNNTSKEAHLQARHWKLALEEAAQMVASHWKTVGTNVKEYLKSYFRTRGLDENERHYANWLVCGCRRQFFWLMEGHIPDPSSKGLKRMGMTKEEMAYCKPFDAPKRKHNIALHVRKLIVRSLKHRSYPRCKAPTNRVDFDASCFSVFTVNRVQSLTLMSLKEPRSKRIRVNLLGCSKICGTIQLIREETGEYTFRVCHHIACEPQRDESVKAGIDTGYTEVFVDQDGNSYGEGFGKKMTEISERRHQKGKIRNQFHAKVKNLRKTGKKEDARKARNIERHNLGRKKLAKQRRKDQETLKIIVNRAINDLLINNPKKIGLLAMEDLTKMTINTVAKSWNRKLSSWMRGYIRQRVEEKCRRCGVKLISVNPAYTSTTCPQCGYVDKHNRKGDTFKCCHCGWSGDADRIAASNILSRADDKDIFLRSSKQFVKAVLDERFRRRLEESKNSTVHGWTSSTVPQGAALTDIASHGIHTCGQQGDVGVKSE